MVGWRFDHCARCRETQRMDRDEEPTNRMVLLSDKKQHARQKVVISQQLSLILVMSPREHRIQRHMSNLAADMTSSGQCDFVLEIPWNSRAVRLGGCIHEKSEGISLCMGSRHVRGVCELIQVRYAEGGWRVVTSMRSVADLLASRSCNEAHWHRPVEGVFPPAASLPHNANNCKTPPSAKHSGRGLNTNLPHTSGLLSSATIGSSRCSSEKCKSCLVSSQECCLHAWDRGILLLHPWLPSFSRGLLLVGPAAS